MRVSEPQILEVIEIVRARDGRASGAAVRAELARRYGARCGVTRVYRLLAAAEGAALEAESTNRATRIGELERALAEALRRAELAEHRERVHQEWAASQIDALRTRLRAIEGSPRVQGVSHEDYLQLHRALAATRLRLAELEAGVSARPGG